MPPFALAERRKMLGSRTKVMPPEAAAFWFLASVGAGPLDGTLPALTVTLTVTKPEGSTGPG